jgi:hypothetical protein
MTVRMFECRRNQRSDQRGTRGGHSRVQPVGRTIFATRLGVTSKFISIGPAWLDMANKSKSAKRINDLIANETPRFETLSSNESQMQKDILLRRTFNASSSFNTYP